MATPHIEGVRDLVEIGRGGFGVVYRGTEVEFGREVAVKVLIQMHDERTKRRFDRERRAMGAVSDHENIVTVYRGGVTPEDQPYLVMEYVRAGSLSQRLSSLGQIDWRDAAAIGAKLADALSVAHRAGILHRDVKPGNVFMTEHGEPKLGDFGIAVLDDGLASQTGTVTASVTHAPPEIVNGQRGEERSDLYSLASTIYELTTGAAPFARDGDDGLSAILSRIATEEPGPLHLEPAAAHFEATVLKGLSKHPESRHTTVAEFGNDLRRAAQATPYEPASSPQTSSISKGQLGFFAALLLVIAVFGGWAVSKAVFAEGEAVAEASPTATATATTEVAPTSAPEPTPEPAPTARQRPTAAPAAASPLAPGFIRVVDNSGALRFDVPAAWGDKRFDITDPDTGRAAIAGRAIAVGGVLESDGGAIDLLDVTEPGMYIFAERAEFEPDVEALLDRDVREYRDCGVGLRDEIPLADGIAHYQILECDRRDGQGTSGVVVYAMVLQDDPTVGLSMSIQLTDINSSDVLAQILPTIRIDADLIPAAGELE